MGVESGQQAHDPVAGRGVQAASGLIGQDQRRLVGQGAGHSHPLALATAELAGQMVHAISQAHQLQQVTSSLPVLATGARLAAHGHLHVLPRAQGRQQIVELEDEAHSLGPKAIQVLDLSQILAIDEYLAAGRSIQGTDHVEQRRLAAATRPHDG